MMTNFARLILWTDRDGTLGVTPVMTEEHAKMEQELLRGANEAHVHCDLEPCDGPAECSATLA